MAMRNKSHVGWVRLHPKDAAIAKKIADKLGLPLSTWMRMVVLAALDKEKLDA
jgi:hypothetical protein